MISYVTFIKIRKYVKAAKTPYLNLFNYSTIVYFINPLGHIHLSALFIPKAYEFIIILIDDNALLLIIQTLHFSSTNIFITK